MDYNELVREHNELAAQRTVTGVECSRIWEIRLKIQKECGNSCWDDGYKGCDFDYIPLKIEKSPSKDQTINNAYKTTTMEIRDVLSRCTIEGNVVKLPTEQLDRKLYQEVAQSLNLIGGVWKGGKVFGFVFKEDPTELLNQI